jgi:hypothetical protein
MPNLVFEVVSEIRTLVSYQSALNPTDSEWDAWLASAAEGALLGRALAVTEGGHPSRAQQGRLAAFLNGRRALTAVVSNAPTLRFVVSVLTFTNPDIKAFSLAQMPAALRHLGLAPSEAPLALAAVERLRERMARGG